MMAERQQMLDVLTRLFSQQLLLQPSLRDQLTTV